MRKSLIILLLIMPFTALAQLKAYPVDAWHSSIWFSVKFGRILPVKGTFDQFSGTIMLDESDLSKTSATIKVSSASISTGVNIRDNHLKSEDFFEVEKFPELSFTSQRVHQQNGEWHMQGILTMHGVSRSIDLTYQLLHGEEPDNWGNARVTFEGKLTLNRLDFGVGEGQAGIGNEVTIRLIISGRVFNTGTIALFDRPFGKEMTAALKGGGLEKARATLSSLQSTGDKDAGKATSFEFLYLKMEQDGLPKKALEALKLYTETFPKEAEAFSLLSYAYYTQDMMEDAKAALKQAIALDERETLAMEMLKLLKEN